MVTNTSRLKDPVSFPKSDAEWHSFLDGYVEEAVQVREYVENLPETAATFNLSDIGLQMNHIPDGVVKLSGAWKCPDLVTDNGAQNWVNPNYTHAQHYSDAVVKCGCGIPVLRQNFGPNEEQPAHHQDHKDSCTKINRLEAQADLLRNRRDILKDCYEHGHTSTGMTHRLGYPRSHHIGGGEAANWGLDLGYLNRQSRKKICRTLMVLCREYNTPTLGTIFGMHKKSVGQMLTKETKSTASALYSVRRANV